MCYSRYGRRKEESNKIVEENVSEMGRKWVVAVMERRKWIVVEENGRDIGEKMSSLS